MGKEQEDTQAFYEHKNRSKMKKKNPIIVSKDGSCLSGY